MREVLTSSDSTDSDLNSGLNWTKKWRRRFVERDFRDCFVFATWFKVLLSILVTLKLQVAGIGQAVPVDIQISEAFPESFVL